MNISRITLDEARPIWEDLTLKYPGKVPFSTFSWFETWVSIFGKDKEPYILYAGNAIAPFMRDADSVSFYPQSTDYNDLIGDKALWPVILEYLRKDGVKHLVIDKIPSNSETLNYFKAKEQSYVSPILDLPETFDQYLSGIKEKRRKYRKFMNENPLIKVETSKNPEKDIEVLVDLMEKIDFKAASSTEERRGFFKKIATSCKDYVWLQNVILDSKIIASQLMFINKDEVMLYISGHEGVKYPNVGTFLIISAIKASIEKGFKSFNFLNGNRSYKYELGAVDTLLYKIELNL